MRSLKSAVHSVHLNNKSLPRGHRPRNALQGPKLFDKTLAFDKNSDNVTSVIDPANEFFKALKVIGKKNVSEMIST